MRILRSSSVLFLALATLAGTASAQDRIAECDNSCLEATMNAFVAMASASVHDQIDIATNAEIRENGSVTVLAETAWAEVATVNSHFTVADAHTGNVVSRAGVTLDDGSPGYISTRLRVRSGEITDVELSSDTSERVVAEYVNNLSPVFNRVEPEDQRLSREELEVLGRRYFQDLTDKDPLESDFTDGCNRFHSGQQITNVASNTVEAGGNLTCYLSILGPKPWTMSIEHRFPVIDEERQLIFGLTLLLYDNDEGERWRAMYVSEIFKVENGQIALIDNIGLIDPDLETLGFQH